MFSPERVLSRRLRTWRNTPGPSLAGCYACRDDALPGGCNGRSKSGNAVKYFSMSNGRFPVKRRTVSLMRSSSPAAIASCHPSDNSTRHAGSPDLFLHSRPVSRAELVERALDALADCLEHFKAHQFLVVRLHERPGGASGRRALDHVGGGRLVEIPLLAVT